MANRGKLEAARELDRRLKNLVERSRRAEAEVAATLLEMKQRGLFRPLGYARIQDYAESELDLSPSKVKDLIEIAARIGGLPSTRQAFQAGELPWTKARQVVRVASAETEEHWLAQARALSNRGLEAEVARARGEEPKVVVVLELTPAEAADLDLAVKRLREERGEAVPLGSAVAEACRRSLGPPVDRPGYQVVIHECPRCETASRDARGGSVTVSRKDLEAAMADAAILDLREGGKGAFRHSITPAERRAVIARDREQCALCGSRTWLHIHHVVRKDGDPAVLSLLCSTCHKRLIHAGHVTVDGRAPGLEFRLADGSLAPVRVG